MKCKQCNNDIPRGKKYKGEHFVSYDFCSEGCYKMYARTHTPHKRPTKPSHPSKSTPTTRTTTKTNPPSTSNTVHSDPKTKPKPKIDGNSGPERRKLTDWIDQNWPIVDINWPWITSQIKNIQEIYELSYKQMRLIMKYAVQYEGVIINPEMGLGQFFPRYIEAGIKFAERCNEVRLLATVENDLLQEELVVMPAQRNTPRKYWGDLTLTD